MDVLHEDLDEGEISYRDYLFLDDSNYAEMKIKIYDTDCEIIEFKKSLRKLKRDFDNCCVYAIFRNEADPLKASLNFIGRLIKTDKRMLKILSYENYKNKTHLAFSTIQIKSAHY